MKQKGQPTNVPNKKQNSANKKIRLRHFIANFFLSISGFIVAISGLVIQIHYHIGHYPQTSTVLFLGHTFWNTVHVWGSATFLLILVYHVRIHRKWYKNVFRQQPSPRKRATLILTFLTIITIFSGLIPLLVSCFDSTSSLRFTIVEIHDKVAILFLIIAFFHAQKRFK